MKQGRWLGRVARGVRPDRNPLRRRWDRVEAFIFGGLVIVAAAGARAGAGGPAPGGVRRRGETPAPGAGRRGGVTRWGPARAGGEPPPPLTASQVADQGILMALVSAAMTVAACLLAAVATRIA